MSEPKNTGSDPSMDDILASIRKIISDDEARAQMTNQRASGPQAPGQPARLSVVPSPNAPRPEPNSRSAGQDDVLLLTEELMEDPKAPNQPPPQPAEPARAPEPARASVLGADAPLIDGSAAGAAADAFSRLSLAVQESVPTPAASDPGMLVGGKQQTVEDLVKDMLRPMLKDWLDRNLPGIVERYVEREIVRLTRR